MKEVLPFLGQVEKATSMYLLEDSGIFWQGNVDGAAQLCDKQRGSVGNVIKAGLRKYKEMEVADDLEKDQKKLAISRKLKKQQCLNYRCWKETSQSLLLLLLWVHWLDEWNSTWYDPGI
ncbi:MAG: hypothetical protein R3B93_04770 [Bacteroidia bacterium]